MMGRLERIRRREVREHLEGIGMRFGVPMELYSEVGGTFDVETGERTGEVKSVYRMRKAVTFQITHEHKFEYDLSYIAANKNFTYGSEFQVGDRIVIVHRSDGLQAVDDLSMDDMWFVYNGQRLDIQKKEQIDFNLGWIVHLRHMQGSEPARIIDKHVSHFLTVDQEITVS